MLEELKNIKSGKKELRDFGLTIGIILVVVGAILLWRERNTYPYFLGIGTLLVICGLALPAILKPLQKLWMALSVILGFFMSRLILIILFYAVLAPIGILAKILGKDILDQRIDKKRDSYWHKRAAGLKDIKSYENQY